MAFKDNIDGKKWLAKDIEKYSGNKRIIMDNEGRNLTINGYDAIYIEDKEYYVILNRSKVYVEK